MLVCVISRAGVSMAGPVASATRWKRVCKAPMARSTNESGLAMTAAR